MTSALQRKSLSFLLSVLIAVQGLPFYAKADVNTENEGAETMTTIYDAYIPAPVTFTDTEWTGEGETSSVFSLGKELARVDAVPYDTLPHALSGAVDYDKTLSPYYRLLSG